MSDPLNAERLEVIRRRGGYFQDLAGGPREKIADPQCSRDAVSGRLLHRIWQSRSSPLRVRLARNGRPSRASPARRLTPHQRTQSRRQLARWLCAKSGMRLLIRLLSANWQQPWTTMEGGIRVIGLSVRTWLSACLNGSSPLRNASAPWVTLSLVAQYGE